MPHKPELAAVFQNPPAAYRPMPQWSWNGDLTRERITQQLEQFAAQGCGGLFTHARPGHITGYMSDAYLDMWRFALDEAARLGIAFHIYDEFMCPAGHAGGLVTAEYPHLALRELTLVPYAGLATYPPAAYSHWQLDPAGGELVQLTGDDVRAATPQAPAWALTTRAHAATAQYGNHPFPDLLRRETFDAFVATTHERYAAWAGDQFNSDFDPAPGAPDHGVRFMFCDEPELLSTGGLPLSEHLLKAFRQDHGYDLEDHLPALAFGPSLPLRGEDTQEDLSSPSPWGGDTEGGLSAWGLRFDYWWTVNRLLNTSFMKPMAAWCDDHDLLFTGHMMEHEWPSPRSHPSAMASLRWMQAPGTDLLGFQYTPTTPEQNGLYLLNLLELRSVKRQLNREWMLVESCGAGGYDEAFEIFKPLEDLLLAFGFNVIDPHLTHQTLAGMRKYDWPQTISDHSPWWDHYRHQADHVARVNTALSQGRDTAGADGTRILVLHPTTTGWLHYTAPVFERFTAGGAAASSIGVPDTTAMDTLRQSQIDLLLALQAAQLDLDLGDEFILEELAQVRGPNLCITPPASAAAPSVADPYDANSYDPSCYAAVVLPPAMETWTTSTLALITAYLQGGGHLYTVRREDGAGTPVAAPALVDGRPSAAPAQLQAAHPDHWHIYDSLDALVAALREACPPALAAPDGNALPAGLQWRQVALDEGRTLTFLCNPWATPIETEIRLPGRALVTLNTATGTLMPHAAQPDGDSLIVPLSLPPRSHVLWLTTPEPDDGAIAEVTPPRRENAPVSVDLSLTGIERRSPNLLMIDYCDVAMPGLTLTGVHHMHADDVVWRRRGFEGNPWGRSHQFKRTLIDHRVDPEDTCRIAYHFEIDASLPEDARRGLCIGVERPWLYTVTLNGRPLDVATAPRWFDEDARALAIGEHLHTGSNTLILEAHPISMLCEIMPVYLTGNFAAAPAATGFTVTGTPALALGDWTQQGLGFYPDKVRYSFGFELTSAAPRLDLTAPEWAGSIVVVHLDGAEIGVIAHPPYTLTLRDVAPGAHRLDLDVVGNMRNMMGPHHADGLAGQWTWARSPRHQPPGAAYKASPSGLLAMPRLMRQ